MVWEEQERYEKLSSFVSAKGSRVNKVERALCKLIIKQIYKNLYNQWQFNWDWNIVNLSLEKEGKKYIVVVVEEVV